VHEFRARFGGTQRIFDALARRYPLARVLGPPDNSNGRRSPFLVPVHARRMGAAPLGSPTVVLSLAHYGPSLGVRVPPGARYLCYSAGLPPNLYHRFGLFVREEPVLLRPALRALRPALRAHHRALMRRPHRLLTNSAWSARALARVHAREPQVVHPPVGTDFFTPAPVERGHFLVVGRLVPDKRVELALDAFRGLDETLVVVGGGRWLRPLEARAPANVRFTGFVSDAELRALYRRSIALISPSVEDFGIAMVEAQATGTPVIAPRAGGALEVVADGVTGLLIDDPTPLAIAKAVRAIRALRLGPDACRASAMRFSEDRFLDAIDRVMDEELALAGR
jgi:glycosyltransferase involved in cell wall biosynthesis